MHSSNTSASIHPTFYNDGNYYFTSNVLYLVNTNAHNEIDFARDHLEWDSNLYLLLKQLRSASKQPDLSTKMSSFGLIDIDLPSSIEYPHIVEQCATQKWHLETAISYDDLQFVGSAEQLSPPPSYDTFLLDAIDALLHEDYRTTVLFSVLAMEHVARINIDEAVDAALQGISTIGGLRVEFLPPIHPVDNDNRRERLKKILLKDSRFQQLLDELPLIFVGRSVLMEDQNLYRKAVELYSERNKLAHRGTLTEEDRSRISGITLATEAVDCAIRIIEWFGERGGYANPLDKNGGLICYTARYED